MTAIQYDPGEDARGVGTVSAATLFVEVFYPTQSSVSSAAASAEEAGRGGHVKYFPMREEEEDSIQEVFPTSETPLSGNYNYNSMTISRTLPALEETLPLSETFGYNTNHSTVQNGYEPKIGTSSSPVTWFFTNDTGLWNSTTDATHVEPDAYVSSPARDIIVGTLLTMICFAVVFGNALVVLAIYRERYLRTTTNYFIASLAVADFFIGMIVLPFAIYQELRPSQWVFGYVWCDAWHAIDVFLCTASIMNLTVIAVDRFWAITMPLNYPTKMTKRFGACLISIIWIVSSLISFPFIAWWHAVEPIYPPNECIFTTNAIYLVISSCISFYIPSITMIVLYWKVFVTAVEQVRSLRCGAKKFGAQGGPQQMMRIHRGGNSRIERNPLQRKMNGCNSANGSPCLKYGSIAPPGGHEKKKFFSGMAKEHKAAKTLGE